MQTTRIKGALLGTRFGRRIFLMFCVAAILPAAVVFWMTYRTAAADARQASEAALQTASKNYALAVFERLETSYGILEQVDPDAMGRIEYSALLDPFFREMALVGSQGRPNTDVGGLEARLQRVLARSGPASSLHVLPGPAAGTPPEIVLLRRSQHAGQEAVIAGALRPSFLWGNPDEVGFDGQVCVYAREQRLFCAGDAIAAHGGEEERSGEWALFLKPRFNAASWNFVTTAKPVATLEQYSGILAPLVMGVLLLAMLLSSLQIRRILVPLSALLAKIRSIDHGATPPSAATSTAISGEMVGIATDDEFGVLSQTFTDMGHRIGRQFDTLRTLSDVDRLILARAPVNAVIEVVISRIRLVLADATISIVVHKPALTALTKCYLRPRQSGTTEVVESARPPASGIASEKVPSEGLWIPTAELGEGEPQESLRRCGDEYAFVFPLGRRGETHAWVALGFLHAVAYAGESFTEVIELAERIAVAMAVEERENLLVFQARHDPLTGLPNRLAAFETLSMAVNRAKASGDSFAVIFLDLDRFKSINDGLGHAIGDKVLIQAGERIGHHLRSSDFVGRFGGDEFFIILRRIAAPQDAMRIAEKIAAGFAMPITADGVELFLGFSAGIALYPRDGEDADGLIRNSDVAMYRAKKSGGGRIEFFEEEMSNQALARMQLENDLRLAIKHRQLQVHYQPRVDSRSGHIVGVEALARWTHPVNGRIAPPVFIALAEECGLIEELGTYVLELACLQLAEWKRLGFHLPLMAVNVSSHQLRSGAFTDIVRNAVETSGIAWRELEIEVTETLLIHDSGIAAAQLQGLRDLGVTVAIDDFGTGYSSLAYLTKLPTDTLKIDRAFMIQLQGGEQSVVAVVRSIIAMAQALDKRIVAEGVESMAQVEMLAAWGCHIIQGFVYYPPLTPEQMTEELGRAAVTGL